MIGGTTHTEFQKLLRKANKLVNLWIKNELPYIYSNYVTTAIKKNEKELHEEANPTWLEPINNEYSRKEEEEFAQRLVDEPSFDFIAYQRSENRGWNRLPESEIEYKCLFKLKKIRSAIEFNLMLSKESKQQQLTAWLRHYRIITAPQKRLENPHAHLDFNLYLCQVYRDDEDVIIDEKYLSESSAESLKIIIRDIKKHIEDSAQDDFYYLFDLDLLLKKLTLLLPLIRFEDDSAQDFSMLEKWARLGLLLIDKSKKNQNCDVIAQSREQTETITGAFYAMLAYHVSHTSKKENIFANSYLEIGLSFKKINEEYFERLRLCVLSRIALNDGENDLALKYVEKAYADYRKPTLFLIEMLYCVGMAYADLNKEITIKCYRRATALIESQKKAGDFHYIDQPNVDITRITTFMNQYRVAIMDVLKNEFDNIKVSIRNDKLNVFLSLDQLPRTQIKLSKDSPISCFQRFSNHEINGKKLTGYGFILSDENYEASILAVRDLTTKISKYLDAEVSRRVVFEKYNAATVSTLKPVIAAIKDMGIRDVENMSNMQNNPSEPKKPANRNQKHKSSSTTTTTTKPAMMPQRTHKRIAADYGFSVFSRKPVTPLYFSCAHKDSGRSAQIIVCWDDSKAEDLDPIIIGKFKDLFDPQGVVQTRQVGESGFKICIGKKNEWIVRGKLKGVGGSTRVYFKPTQTVTNEDKSTTTLCVLHKKMSK